MEQQIDVSVRLFASFSDIVGRRELSLQLPQGTTVAGLRKILSERYPALGTYIDRVLVAVNLDYADSSRKLESGDEVAVFPPVSGGAP